MPEPLRYEFNERLAFSDGVTIKADVQSILLAEIPGALCVERATEADDRSGVDWWVYREGTPTLSVDAKVRKQDWAAKTERYRADDLALETWSVMERHIPGWTRNPLKQSDYILWLWCDTGRWCLIAFPLLCAVMQDKWQEWQVRFKRSQQFTPTGGGYHSECVFVPRREVWKEIYLRFSGVPAF